MEKEGLKVEQQNKNEPMFMKLKIAKFILKKSYQPLSLQELLNQKKNLMRSHYQSMQPGLNPPKLPQIFPNMSNNNLP